MTDVTLVAGKSLELLARREICVWLISSCSPSIKNKMPPGSKGQKITLFSWHLSWGHFCSSANYCLIHLQGTKLLPILLQRDTPCQPVLYAKWISHQKSLGEEQLTFISINVSLAHRPLCQALVFSLAEIKAALVVVNVNKNVNAVISILFVPSQICCIGSRTEEKNVLMNVSEP